MLFVKKARERDRPNSLSKKEKSIAKRSNYGILYVKLGAVLADTLRGYFPSVSALKTIRKKRKLSQEELAILSGVNVRSIRAYEQGKKDITKAQGDTLQMLAKALDCSIEELFNL